MRELRGKVCAAAAAATSGRSANARATRDEIIVYLGSGGGSGSQRLVCPLDHFRHSKSATVHLADTAPPHDLSNVVFADAPASHDADASPGLVDQPTQTVHPVERSGSSALRQHARETQ